MPPRLLCVTYDAHPMHAHARLLTGLIPRLRPSFSDIRLFTFSPAADWGVCVHGSGHADDLLKVLEHYDPTHVFCVGSHTFLSRLVHAGVNANDLPQRHVIACLLFDVPLPDPGIATIPPQFDACVTLGEMSRAALRNAASVTGSVHKRVYHAAKASKAVLPGVDTAIFRPIDRSIEPMGREDVRHTLFGGEIDDDAHIVVFPVECEISLALGVLAGLRKTSKTPVVGIRLANYPHLDAYVDGYELPEGVIRHVEWPADPEQRRLVWCAADTVLTASVRSFWPFDVQEAMACGALVCAPDHHCWAEAIHERGVELPSTRVTAVEGGYSFETDVTSAVAAIQTANRTELLASAHDWFAHSPHAGWEACAADLLEVMGVRLASASATHGGPTPPG